MARPACSCRPATSRHWPPPSTRWLVIRLWRLRSVTAAATGRWPSSAGTRSLLRRRSFTCSWLVARRSQPASVCCLEIHLDSGGRMQPTGEPQPQPIRAGDRDRDAVVQRLQEAFAEGRLDDDEFDRRTRAALTATLDTDLAVLTRDLPDRTVAVPVAALAPAERTPGRFAVA